MLEMLPFVLYLLLQEIDCCLERFGLSACLTIVLVLRLDASDIAASSCILPLQPLHHQNTKAAADRLTHAL